MESKAITIYTFNKRFAELVKQFENEEITPCYSLPDFRDNSFKAMKVIAGAMLCFKTRTEVFKDASRVLRLKSHEYSTSANRYMNFENAAIPAKIQPIEVLNYYKLKHWEWCRANQPTPENIDSLGDSPFREHYGDLFNYTVLGYIYSL